MQKQSYILYESPVGLHLFLLRPTDQYSMKNILSNNTELSYESFSALTTIITLKSTLFYKYFENDLKNFFCKNILCKKITDFLDLNEVNLIYCNESLVGNMINTGYRAKTLPPWIYRGIKVNEAKLIKGMFPLIEKKEVFQRKMAFEFMKSEENKIILKPSDLKNPGIKKQDLETFKNKMEQKMKFCKIMMEDFRKSDETDKTKNFNDILMKINEKVGENIQNCEEYENKNIEKILPRTSKVLGPKNTISLIKNKNTLNNLSFVDKREIKRKIKKIENGKNLSEKEKKKYLKLIQQNIQIDCFRE